MTAAVYAMATMDTKGDELAYVSHCMRRLGVAVKMVDVSTLGEPTVQPDITCDQVLQAAKQPGPLGSDRGKAISIMGDALRDFLLQEYDQGNVCGVIGLGGSGGTALISTAMRALPVGLPKLMVSTMASGNTAPYVDCSDITMMYSVVDVAGLNRVSIIVLANAAHAMAGMVSHTVQASDAKPVVGMTMFGVTTPCVTAVRKQLESQGWDCLVFHATGAGGRSMEKLVESGMIQAVLDITTTEVADEVVGGILPAGKERFDRILRRQVPYVVSLGALDMVNFGALETVPEKFKNRTLHVHNSQVTLMRTTPEENRTIAAWIADKLNRATSPVRILIPEKGVSALDAEGQPFFDPAADKSLFEAIEQRLHQDKFRQVQRHALHINDPRFADELVKAFLAEVKGHSQTGNQLSRA
jgi:uncharacterized protein (UPF0261 family)